MSASKRILFVCLGNICRSPLAEGIFRDYVEKTGQSHLYEIDSAGTSGWHAGEMPDKGSIRIAAARGIDIRSQRSRKLTHEDFDKFDFIVAMDASNIKKIKELREPREGQLLLLRDFDPDSSGRDVPDPWSHGDEAFREVFDIIESCMPRMMAKISETETEKSFA